MCILMYKLEPVYKNDTSYINDAIGLLLCYGELIFSCKKNPVAVFLNGIETNSSRAIVAVLDDKIIGVVVLYDFQYFSQDKFICYMYGAATRGVAKYIELGLSEIFASLKKQGCVALRLETKKYNLPMRFMAKRLGFRKVGEFICGNEKRGKILKNLVYEKVL